MADEKTYHKSPFTGAQIDKAIDLIITGNIDKLALQAKDAAVRAEAAAVATEDNKNAAAESAELSTNAASLSSESAVEAGKSKRETIVSSYAGKVSVNGQYAYEHDFGTIEPGLLASYQDAGGKMLELGREYVVTFNGTEIKGLLCELDEGNRPSLDIGVAVAYSPSAGYTTVENKIDEAISIIIRGADNTEISGCVEKSQNAATTAQTASNNAAASATEATQAKTAAQAIAEELAYFLNSIAVDVYYDPYTYLLKLLNADGEQIGAGTTIKAGLSDVEMVVEKNESTGESELVLYDGDGEEISRVPLPAGGGGGGGGATYTVTFKNLLETRTISAPEDAPVELKFTYSSVDEEGYGDGNGVGSIVVNGVKRATIDIVQGENIIDVSPYLGTGSSSVRVTVENSEGTTRSITYTAQVVVLKLTTTISNYPINTGDFIFYYTPIGDGIKTVYFVMDGVEIGTATVSSTGRSQSFTIPAQPHGGHTFECYAEMTVSGVTVTSNTIKLGMAWVDLNNSSAFVLSTFDMKEVVQGEPLTITYLPYDPTSEEATVTRSVIDADGNIYAVQVVTAGRSEQEWVVQDYPIGEVKFRIAIGDIGIDLPVTVTDSGLVIAPVTDSLVFEFNPLGRSNQETEPGHWEYGDVAATFSGIGFNNADGWMTDSDGAPMLRLLPGAQMNVPFHLLSSDLRDTGAAIEVEMATHNVRDYDSVVMSCLSNNRGFMIASQYAELHSEQSSISKQFKEDEKIRVSFVIEPKNLHRMIYVYIDGIMCGAIQYPTDDNFAQSPAVGITIGAESSGIDVYRIRLYKKGLTRHEILDNFTADQPTIRKRIDAYNRNNIFDTAEDVVISKLPATLPYMIITCPELPQTKGDKKVCDITYVDPANSTKSFTAEDAVIDVQGTSSAGYKKKNWKITYVNGLTLTAEKTKVDNYQLRANSIPANCFCMKADVASSEGANNVELVRLYNDIVPCKTPPQEVNPNVRVGIDGLPCVIFWQNSDTGTVRFWGKYNFNDEKSSNQVYGLTDTYPNAESWEIKNNTSNRVIFKSADFEGTDWLNDFEARYPDGNTDPTQLKAMCEWVVSTDRTAATGAALAAAVNYGGVTYTNDTAAYRLAKFKAEFEDHFVKDAMLFYYLFTETFLMVDNRAKNFFPSTYDGVHWLPLPYDMDTAMGINNEGQLVFEYDLEDTDTVGEAEVFNGQYSVLWCNVRDAFPDELKSMYANLRSNSVFNYDEVITRWADHQNVWPEAIWNEDAWDKYLEPLENDNDGGYLAMLQGDKASQREWWMFNGFRYRDSKYQCKDATEKFITLRCYTVGDITITPYSNIWTRIKYGSYVVSERAKRNQEVTLECPLDEMNDTEVYIYSSDRLAKIGDLSHLQVGYANFTMAPKLQLLKLGDSASGYTNTRLNELYVGNNDLLDELDVQNCTNLKMAVDLSGCIGLDRIKAKGSSVTGFTLPVGGRLKSLELPATVTNLTLRELSQFETLDMTGYGAITTLRIENTPNVPVGDILNGMAAGARVRLIGVEWEVDSEDDLRAQFEKLEACAGLDADGNNTSLAVITGRVHVPSISLDLLGEINTTFPQLVVVANGVPQYYIRYLDWDNTLLYSYIAEEGSTAIDPVAAGYVNKPSKTGSETEQFVYTGFGTLPTNISNNITLVAQYVSVWRVRFMAEGTVHETQWVRNGQNAAKPATDPTKESTAQYKYTFAEWGDYTNITAARDVLAEFTAELRKYNVYFYNGSTVYATQPDLPYGTMPTVPEGTPVFTGEDPDDYEFIGWEPEVVAVTGETKYYAVYKYNQPIFRKIIDRELPIAYTNDRVTEIGANAFAYCNELPSVCFPNAVTVGGGAFYLCGIRSADFSVLSNVGNRAFGGAMMMETLVIRTTSGVATAGSNVLYGSRIEDGKGYIYVPAALVDSYKSASGWSDYANQFRALEDYTVDGTITGELDPGKI